MARIVLLADEASPRSCRTSLVRVRWWGGGGGAAVAHIGVIPGMEEYLKEFTSKKAMGNRGYLAKIGLVPLASDKYKVTRTAALDLNTISIK